MIDYSEDVLHRFNVILSKSPSLCVEIKREMDNILKTVISDIETKEMFDSLTPAEIKYLSEHPEKIEAYTKALRMYKGLFGTYSVENK